MVEKQLYEYVIIKQEKADKDGEIVDEAAILAGPDSVLAASEDEARIHANRAIPDEAMAYLDRVTVGVRPFDDGAALLIVAGAKAPDVAMTKQDEKRIRRHLVQPDYGVGNSANAAASATYMHTHQPATYTQADLSTTTFESK